MDDDREQMRMRGDRQSRLAYHAEVAAQKADILETRARLGEVYLARHAEHDRGELVSRETGFGKIDLRGLPAFEAALAEAQRLAKSREDRANPSKGSLEFVATGADYDAQSAAVALATSPQVLCPVIRYFQRLPILFGIGFNRASANEKILNSSHMLHVDPEDTTQLKVFVPLTVVEEDRAFYALPAPLTDIVVEKLRHTMGRLSDDVVEGIVGPGRLLNGAGPAGMACVCDTNRCLHFGGRPGRLVRDVLAFTYVLPTSTWFPRFEGDGERRVLLKKLKPRAGDIEWNALIGTELY
jgi:hypothetical protein